MIAEGPLGGSPRNSEWVPREYSEAVTLQSVKEQVNKFSIFVDKEKTTQAPEEHDGLPIIEEPPQVTSKIGKSKRNECMPKTMSEVKEGELENTQAPWTQSKEKDEDRRNLMEFRVKFESAKRKQALCHGTMKTSFPSNLVLINVMFSFK
ncbi:hypothetical protein M9H77_30613 [Catharanthus roseus]|uniref:Uncharacterized protein n=1 Tax=Catharanthus roseus TaxID=4058 RepID=A0ACB9ZY50_CATRO|nr:hypothetical protein M9H77_30613 [Catharanthus roseus]